MTIMKKTIHDEKKHAKLVIFGDHKGFYFTQGDCFGLLAYLSYYEDDVKESLMLLMELIPCNPAEPDKGTRKVAEIIKQFLVDMDLWNLKNQGIIKVVGDHAITKTVGGHLQAMGWHCIENSIGICESHTEQLKLKRTESEFNELIENQDLDGKRKFIISYFLFFI